MGLFWKGKIRIIAKFHTIDLVIYSHSTERKTPFYSQIITVLIFLMMSSFIDLWTVYIGSLNISESIKWDFLLFEQYVFAFLLQGKAVSQIGSVMDVASLNRSFSRGDNSAIK